MLALSLSDQSVRDFMNKLLKGDTFDRFETRSVTINSFARFDITGAPDEEQIAEEEQPSQEKKVAKQKFVLWETMRPYIFQLIKGNVQPKMIKVVFSLSQEEMEGSFENAKALFINVLFNSKEGRIILTTGSAQKTFSMDKSLDMGWDVYIQNFLSNNQIQHETM